jgi:multiple sugar transport system ATP-binding protein
MASVGLEGVSKVFPGGVRAVERIDLEVREREFLVLVGPSGCGKSTTLRMIAGLEDVTSGTIHIGPRVVNDVAPKDRNIAMVFQNYALYPHMSVYKNMAFGLELRYGSGWLTQIWNRLTRPAVATELAEKRKGIKREVEQAAKILGIEHLLNRMPRQLSGGERQRVAVGRAIVRQPAAFLFDEPLSNLDAQLRVEMRRELKRLHRQLQATMIYVTHDQVEALTLGQRIVVMNRGEIQQVGTPMEVYDRPRNRFVAGFIGAPAMNFVEGKLEPRDGGLRFVAPGLAAALDGTRFAGDVGERLRTYVNRSIVFGIRPEDVSVTLEAAAADASAVGASQRRVSAVELFGDAAVLYLEFVDSSAERNSFEDTLVCKTEARTRVRAGDAIRVLLDVQRGHLFDPQSGENLTLSKVN